jgi:hypothetical protein
MASSHDDPTHEPAPMRKDRNAEEVEAHGPVFEGRPRGTEVEQQTLGDCFFLASLASFADRRPDEVREALQARGDGTFAVRLFRKDHATGTLTPEIVVVDAKLPEEHGAPIYAAAVNGRARWVSLFEKAYAVLRRGYSHLDGGSASTAVEALTGHPAHTTPLEHAHPDAIWEVLERAIAEKRVTVAQTYGDEDARAMLQRRRDRGEAAAHRYDAHRFTYVRHGLVDGHDYSVWGISSTGRHRAVRLRNPWAHFEPKGEGHAKDDGIFTMPFDDWMLLYVYLTVGG